VWWWHTLLTVCKFARSGLLLVLLFFFSFSTGVNDLSPSNGARNCY